MPLPRIITVDPSANIARIVRAAISLIDRPIVQVDVPDGTEALNEVRRGCTLLITPFEIDESTKAFVLAIQAKQEAPDAGVIIIGDEGDPDAFDDEMAAESPFVYFPRPLDVQKFLRVLVAGLDGQDIKAVSSPQSMPVPSINEELGPVPHIDVQAAQAIIDPLLVDLGAMAILLAARDGTVLLERGAVGYINREKLANSLLPAALTAKDVKELVGGQISTVQFFDGENFDVFMLSVGLHHFICIMFDGVNGSRQFGGINRYARRAVEDLIALIGPGAFFFQPAMPVARESAKPRRIERTRKTEEVEALPLEKADIMPKAAPEPEPELKLDPIADLNLDDLFGAPGDAGSGDDLFDFDNLAEDLNQMQTQQKGKLDWDDAEKIGLFGGGGGV